MIGKGLVIGLVGGAFGGLVGLGGGVVMVPMLVGLAKLRQQQAHGTSLVALVFTGLVGAATYFTRGKVDVVGALLLAAPAVFTARLGARYAHALPEWKLKRAFGGFLVLVSILLLSKTWIAGGSVPATGWALAAVLVPVGLLVGFLSGMMGVGGGNMMVPAMVLLAGFPQVLAQGTSLLAMVPAGAVGAHAHWQLGNVVRPLLPGIVLGILLGTLAGSAMALQLPELALRLAFAAILVYTGVKFLRTRRPEAQGG
ncbi:MAG: sulfite exporter TauE/SafE family protein [Deltaproteobacteria bacterium]|nr:sulfite exporter TauE/SafE family protein [Deltaproteobacteria bacterium]